MKSLIKLTFLIAMIFSMSSCKFYSKENELSILNTTQVVKNEDFALPINLESILISEVSENLFIPGKSIAIGDILIISDQASQGLLHLYHITENNYLGIFGSRGAGPLEIFDVWSFFPYHENQFGAYDPELAKVLIYDIDTLLLKNSALKEVIQKDMLYNGFVHISGQELVMTGSYQQEQQFRMFKYNLSDSTVGRPSAFGELPHLSEALPAGLKHPQFRALDADIQATTFVNGASLGDFVLLSYPHLPLIELYNGQTESKISTVGPHQVPSFEELTKEPFYTSPVITKDYLYVLDRQIKDGSEIKVFDLSGKPVKRYRLDIEIFRFSIYQDNLIFALTSNSDNSEYQLVKFHIHE